MRLSCSRFVVLAAGSATALVTAACGESTLRIPTGASPLNGAPLASGAVSLDARAPQVDVCHWSEEEQTWLLLNINGNALRSHLANHDDTPPGGTTPSGTDLDAACQPVASGPLLLCPCWDDFTEQELVAALNGVVVSPGVCLTFSSSVEAFNTALPFLFDGIHALNFAQASCSLQISNISIKRGLSSLTAAEGDQCHAEATRIVQQTTWCSP